MALAVVSLGMAVGTAAWLRPTLAYWPALLAILAIYAVAMLWLTREWLPKKIMGAPTTGALIAPRPVASSAVLPCVYLVVAMGLLDVLIAQVAPTVIGFSSVQMLVFSAISWQRGQEIRRWEQQSGSRLLIRPRLPANRSDFLIQSNFYLP